MTQEEVLVASAQEAWNHVLEVVGSKDKDHQVLSSLEDNCLRAIDAINAFLQV